MTSKIYRKYKKLEKIGKNKIVVYIIGGAEFIYGVLNINFPDDFPYPFEKTLEKELDYFGIPSFFGLIIVFFIIDLIIILIRKLLINLLKNKS